MSVILLSMLIAIIVLILLIFSSVWLMNVLLVQTIGKKHQALEEITASGRIPIEWTKKYQKKLIKLTKKDAPLEKKQHINHQAKSSSLVKLKQLEKYVTKSNLVENEETRQSLLHQLDQFRKQLESDRLPLF